MARLNKKLTLQMLKDMPPHEMFMWGNLIDSPSHINLANTGRQVRWVAVRGSIHDWTIYAQNPHYGNMEWDYEQVKRNGDKITNSKYIKMLIDCDDEAFEMFRY